MSVNHDIPGVEVFGSGRAEFKLPCGYVDSNNKIHNSIILREMTGVEEDMMDDDQVAVTDRITNILASCCEQLGDVTDKKIIKDAIGDTLEQGLPLTAADRVAMLLYLRRVSVGDNYKFEQKCPYCSHFNKNRNLRLDNIEMKHVEKPDKRRVKVQLPRSGRVAVIKILSAGGEKQIAKLRPTQKDVRTLALLARLESLDGQEITPFHIDLVKNLPLSDRSYLREIYDYIEGAVDTDVEVDCSGCGEVFKFPLDLGQVFFSNQAKKVTAQTLEWL